MIRVQKVDPELEWTELNRFGRHLGDDFWEMTAEQLAKAKQRFGDSIVALEPATETEKKTKPADHQVKKK